MNVMMELMVLMNLNFKIYGADESQYKINGVDKSDLDEPMLTDDPDAKINPVVNVMLK